MTQEGVSKLKHQDATCCQLGLSEPADKDTHTHTHTHTRTHTFFYCGWSLLCHGTDADTHARTHTHTHAHAHTHTLSQQIKTGGKAPLSYEQKHLTIKPLLTTKQPFATRNRNASSS